MVADILLTGPRASRDVSPVGYLDDDPSLHGKLLLGLRVLGPISELPHVPHDAVIVAIGKNRTRAAIFDTLTGKGERFAQAVHPAAILAADATLGRGVVICAGAVVNTATQIGDNVILNTGCTVDHHNTVARHVHVAPGAHTGGNVTIREGAFLGIGAVVIPGRCVGEWTTVGGGAAVIDDIPDHTTAVGVPARIVRHSGARDE